MTTDALAADLYRAYRDGDPLDPARLPDISIDEGYAVQEEFVARRAQAEGPVVGYKLGFTNETVQSKLGVSEPAYGRVLRETVCRDRQFAVDSLIEPRVEPEIAFVLDEDLDGSATPLEAMAATRFVVPVVEVVDSRIEGWEFAPATAVADDALAARLLPGDGVAAVEGDLTLEGVEILVNGKRRGSGTGAAVLGHPAEGVAWLARELADAGETLRAGDIVTTGSITDPIPVDAGDTVVARFSSLGSVVAQATPGE